ncbi:beta-ketoadipate enol-lactone hydrolase [Alteribacter lacisalsi]|uniref:Beta-ketoadipate enol-lactone hydrolase n=1 Tax=Alteribacter lacisalsi TaxID=2045244 RepID=A0A2W0HWM5_9BACI|nr:alpha/beta hydrolase [Alteribacter lacisalsi]PYZ98128.1 beta-ketoadipate enol-lactone hydrolase [Alteribacter lacisalsi]
MLLNFQTYESKPYHDWIVLFHGLGGNHTIFHKQIEAFKQDYNLLCVDFPGHGDSPSFDCRDYLSLTAGKVIELMDHLRIERAHFVGVSLGTIVMQEVSLKHSHRIQSMVLAGAASRWLKWGEMLGKLTLSRPVRALLPYMVPYSIFAFLLLPRKNHRKSRAIFIREAFKLGKDDYHKWGFVARDAYKTYQRLRQKPNCIPKLYVSGSEDHMFLKGIRRHVKKEELADLEIINNCGHVCNIEQPDTFNKKATAFLKQIGRIEKKQNADAM